MKVLLLEPNTYLRASLASDIVKQGHSVCAQANYDQQAIFDGNSCLNEYDAIVSEVELTKSSGIILLQHLSHCTKPPPLLLHSFKNTCVIDGHTCELGAYTKMFPFARFVERRVGRRLYINDFLNEVANGSIA